ncbi:unnamed protein product [Symbiodinium sp. CCMP2592]|nr:unnamed protein product [Symbiodinium sp. CCMP2592]
MEPDCEFSVDPSSGNKRKAPRMSSHSRPGPSTFDQIADWPGQLRDDLTRGMPESFLGALTSKFDKMIVLTTHYSGMGCAELALLMLEAEFRRRPEGHETESNVILYSACEQDATTRQMLLGPGHRDSRLEPQHVFGDIISRVPVDILGHLKEVELQHLEQAAGIAANPSLSREEKEEHKNDLGERLLNSFLSVLSRCKFVAKDWCYKHNAMCPLLPAKNGAHIEQLNMEKLLAAHASPDWFIHECVQSFDAQMLVQTVSQYLTASFVFSPTLFGLPSNRTRRFTFGINAARCSWQQDLLDEGFADDPSTMTTGAAQTLFSTVFGRDIVVGCEVYLVASDKAVATWARGAVSDKGLGHLCDSDVDMKLCLSGAQFQRMVAYKDLLREKKVECGSFTSFVVNLEQTAGFQPCVSHIVPALLTQSTLCVLRAQSPAGATGSTVPSARMRLVLPIEHFAILSFPMPEAFRGAVRSSVPESAARKWTDAFPWDVAWLRREMGDKVMRRLTGNGMNLHALGSVMAILLAGCQPSSRESTTSSSGSGSE